MKVMKDPGDEETGKGSLNTLIIQEFLALISRNHFHFQSQISQCHNFREDNQREEIISICCSMITQRHGVCWTSPGLTDPLNSAL